MRFRSVVEPPEPKRGLEVPPHIIESLNAGARPRVKVTLNGHTWSTRIAIMSGRFLIGLSNANRGAADVSVGQLVEVDVELITEPVSVDEPEDFLAALRDDDQARGAYERLTVSQRKQQVRMIESAKKPDTRARRIQQTIARLKAARRPG